MAPATHAAFGQDAGKRIAQEMARHEKGKHESMHAIATLGDHAGEVLKRANAAIEKMRPALQAWVEAGMPKHKDTEDLAKAYLNALQVADDARRAEAYAAQVLDGEGVNRGDENEAETAEEPLQKSRSVRATQVHLKSGKVVLRAAHTDKREAAKPVQNIGKFTTAKGNVVYQYDEATLAANKAEKFKRVAGLAKRIPEIVEDVQGKLALNDTPREKTLSAIVALIDRCQFRLGTEAMAEQNGTYGVSSFKPEHVIVAGDTIRFQFIGKKHVEWDKVITDPALASFVGRLKSQAKGDKLFWYHDKNGEQREVSSSQVNAALAPYGVTAKDFRTYHATRLCFNALKQAQAKRGETLTPAQVKQAVAGAVQATATQLGHTPAVCKQSYILPQIIEDFAANNGHLSIRDPWKTAAKMAKAVETAHRCPLAVDADEREFMAYLQRLQGGEPLRKSVRLILRKSWWGEPERHAEAQRKHRFTLTDDTGKLTDAGKRKIESVMAALPPEHTDGAKLVVVDTLGSPHVRGLYDLPTDTVRVVGSQWADPEFPGDISHEIGHRAEVLYRAADERAWLSTHRLLDEFMSGEDNPTGDRIVDGIIKHCRELVVSYMADGMTLDGARQTARREVIAYVYELMAFYARNGKPQNETMRRIVGGIWDAGLRKSLVSIIAAHADTDAHGQVAPGNTSDAGAGTIGRVGTIVAARGDRCGVGNRGSEDSGEARPRLVLILRKSQLALFGGTPTQVQVKAHAMKTKGGKVVQVKQHTATVRKVSKPDAPAKPAAKVEPTGAPDTVTVTCPKCNGRGYNVNKWDGKHTCPKCGGAKTETITVKEQARRAKAADKKAQENTSKEADRAAWIKRNTAEIKEALPQIVELYKDDRRATSFSGRPEFLYQFLKEIVVRDAHDKLDHIVTQEENRQPLTILALAQQVKQPKSDPAAEYKQLGTKAPSFKAWFGDWENDPANASKVVDAKGEPQETHSIPGTGSKVKDADGHVVIVYHGTSSGGFRAFDKQGLDPNSLYGPGFYFTEDKSVAESYTDVVRRKSLVKQGHSVEGPLSGGDIDTVDEWADYWTEKGKSHTEKDGLTADMAKNFAWWVHDEPDSDHLAHISVMLATAKNALAAAFGSRRDIYTNQLEALRDLCRHLGIEEPGTRSELKECFLNIRRPYQTDGKFTKEDAAMVNKGVAAMGIKSPSSDTPIDLWLEAHIGRTRDSIIKLLPLLPRQWPELLQKAGFDGITHIGGDVMGGGHHHRVWIAFEPTQIKAVDNEGTFDGTQADMYKSLRGRRVVLRFGGRK